MKKLIGVLIIVAVVAIASITIYKQTRTLEGIYEDLHSSTHHVLFEQGMLEDYYTSCRWNSYYKGNEENAKLCMEQADYLNLLEEPYTPYELFYTFKVTDGAYVSQGRFEHANRNGLLADDVATNGKKLKLYAPDLHNEMVDWEVTEEVNKLKGNTIILTNENNRFEIGHSKLTVGEGVVATGNTIGEVLCAGDENVGYVTGGCHIHFTYEVYDGKLWNETPYYTDVNYDADKVVEEKMVKKENNYLEWDSEEYKGFNTPWQILSSIHLKETGRRKVVPETSSAGAVGAMQFMPCTWYNHKGDFDKTYCKTIVNVFVKDGIQSNSKGYYMDGDNDGFANANNYKDAIASADKYLQANLKKEGTWVKSIYRYNNANWYVAHILEEAEVMGLELNRSQKEFIKLNK